MESLSIPRLLLTGTGPGCGKTLLLVGLLYALRKQRVSPSVCVSGSPLLTVSMLRRACGRYIRAIDPQLLSPAQIISTVHQASLGADLVIVDGQWGMLDGSRAGEGAGSDTEIAGLLKLPAVFVADARGFLSSLGAVVQGFIHAAPDVEVSGLVINHASPGSASFWPGVATGWRLPALLGILPEMELSGAIPPRIISQARNSTLLSRSFFVELEKLVETHIDVGAIVDAANRAPAIEHDHFLPPPERRKCRIAVAEDSCFGVCFQDNLDLLRFFGAEMVPFSPLADPVLPRDVGAVYIPGAFLHEYMEELGRNTEMYGSLEEFARKGGVIYSEGAGTAWLCRELSCPEWERPLPGVGILNAVAYAEQGAAVLFDATTAEDSPLGEAGLMVKGIQTGEWRVETGDQLPRLLRVGRPGSTMRFEGYSPLAQVSNTTAFLHLGSNPMMAKALVDAAQVVAPLGER